MIKKLIIIFLLFGLVTCPSYGAYRESKGYDGKPLGQVAIDQSQNSLTRGLIGCWLLNENGGLKTIDLIYQNNGTITSGAFTPSSKGIGLKCDALNTSVNIGAVSKLANIWIPNGCSIAAGIVKLGTGQNNFGNIYSRSPSASSNAIRFLTSDSPTANALAFAFNSSSSAGNPARTSAANFVVSNKYYDVVGTYAGGLAASAITLYANGVTPASYTTTNGTGSITTDDANPSIIGNRNGGARTFNGIIFYVYIWNRVLTPAEVRKLHENPYQIFVVPKRRTISQVIGGALKKVRAFIID